MQTQLFKEQIGAAFVCKVSNLSLKGADWSDIWMGSIYLVEKKLAAFNQFQVHLE